VDTETENLKHNEFETLRHRGRRGGGTVGNGASGNVSANETPAGGSPVDLLRRANVHVFRWKEPEAMLVASCASPDGVTVLQR